MIKRTAKIMLAHIDYLHGGLCELAMDLRDLSKLSEEEAEIFTYFVDSLYPHSIRPYGGYIWKPGDKDDRIAFLKHVINGEYAYNSLSDLLQVLLHSMVMIEHKSITGLCHLIYDLRVHDVLSEFDAYRLNFYIDKHKPFNYYLLILFGNLTFKRSKFMDITGYYWSPFKTKPRIVWLRKHIKKLKKIGE